MHPIFTNTNDYPTHEPPNLASVTYYHQRLYISIVLYKHLCVSVVPGQSPRSSFRLSFHRRDMQLVIQLLLDLKKKPEALVVLVPGEKIRYLFDESRVGSRANQNLLERDKPFAPTSIQALNHPGISLVILQQYILFCTSGESRGPFTNPTLA